MFVCFVREGACVCVQIFNYYCFGNFANSHIVQALDNSCACTLSLWFFSLMYVLNSKFCWRDLLDILLFETKYIY